MNNRPITPTRSPWGDTSPMQVVQRMRSYRAELVERQKFQRNERIVGAITILLVSAFVAARGFGWL